MSENSSSSSDRGNSWTFLTPGQEAGVENVVAVGEDVKIGDQLVSQKRPESYSEEHNSVSEVPSEASVQQTESEPSEQSQSDSGVTSAPEQEKEDLPEVTPAEAEGRAQLHSAHGGFRSAVETLGHRTNDHEEQDGSGLIQTTSVSLCPDVDSFSDSYTHFRPASGSGTLEASRLKTTAAGDANEGLRKRQVSHHLGSLDQSRAEDDDDDVEEEFQPPQREEEALFSLNKCILGAVILLGLGTIFFSGLLMDQDDESDVDGIELNKARRQEWMNPSGSQEKPAGLQAPDVISRLTEESQQMLTLQRDEVTAAQLLMEERVKREELEKDYQRIQAQLKQENQRMEEESERVKRELERENQRMEESERVKRELQAELQLLKERVSHFTQSTGPVEHSSSVSGIPVTGDKRDVPPVDRQEMKPRKSVENRSERREKNKDEKDWKKKRSWKNYDDNEKKEDVEHLKKKKDEHEINVSWKSKERKAEKETKSHKKRDEDKTIKSRGNNEWLDKEKKDKDWIKDEHEGEKKKLDRNNWKDPERKKNKEEKHTDKKEKKSYRNGKERQESQKDTDWKPEKQKTERTFNDKQNQWREKEQSTEGTPKKHWRKRESKDEGVKKGRIMEEISSQKHERKVIHNEDKPKKLGDLEGYWSRQRARIEHVRSGGGCSGPEDCARAQGVVPVRLREFQSLLQEYLNKLQDPTEQTALTNLVKEFFTHGVFTHHRIPFSEFVEDVADILEDLAEGDEGESEVAEEMEGFSREAMEKFALPEKRSKWKKSESGRVKG